MEYQTGMSEQIRKQISTELSTLLAESYALYLKVQDFHWNVTGPGFFGLHIFFEKQYQDLAEALDEIAERIRALGFFVEGSFSAFQKLSSLKEEKGKQPKEAMLKHLIEGHESVIRHLRSLNALADKEKDFATTELLSKRLLIHEKFAWMARSELSS
ncbi:MAG: DNA starvation/stationary phase protection protein [Chlamydiae bacterium GWC2_50_10]|nr:MAG: DNA starvation/stationary phase protection protein [Chlamydiae bacterium GWC2_50_10]OGN55071.1 MAG: DNA starvation/stationary phase protection protein [Chlamydiae bacterium GWF2_49_8]OGN57781.1 MAG: DNA starvation/stationary phase protection protein [Chlamydiae bacterium RIFCSPHIGHO2_02_FULL_49_29]OGN63458.1 MAG: DNA starvation/stationary phase protection protein [Chlamydiae bacterium RIFCSPHIGHO2_12_FULL_49_32]OGN68254.1 MAG: DNA starvation/stationary phase protection protein [Chlamydi